MFTLRIGERESCIFDFRGSWPTTKSSEPCFPAKLRNVRKVGKLLIVGFEMESEDDDWDDGTGWMGSLMSLRSDLLRGDLRCLYLGWLLCAQNEEFAEDDTGATGASWLG